MRIEKFLNEVFLHQLDLDNLKLVEHFTNLALCKKHKRNNLASKVIHKYESLQGESISSIPITWKLG